MALSREKWRSRLIDAGIPKEVVDEMLAQVKDKDLVRMKDMPVEEIKEFLRGVAKADDAVTCPKCKAVNLAEAMECKECKEKFGVADDEEEDKDEEKKPPTKTKEDDAAITDAFQKLADLIVSQVKEAIEIQEVEVDVPELATLVTDVAALKDQMGELSTTLKEMAESWKEIFQDDTQRLKDMVDNLSPAQRKRLRSSITDADMLARMSTWFTQRKDAGALPPDMVVDSGAVIKDTDGNKYASFGDFMTGNPVGA